MARKKAAAPGLGSEIRHIRERLRYSQDELGVELSVSGALISRWELGDIKPTLDSLARLADLAGKTEEERDDLYLRWLRMAGFRAMRTEETPAVDAVVPELAPATLEGAMARMIIDQERDPDRRMELVLRLREWVLHTRAAGAETAPAIDPPPSRPARPAAPDAVAMPGTLTPAG